MAIERCPDPPRHDLARLKLHPLVEHIPRLRRYARALVRDRDSADDLVQDTLERAANKLRLWRPGRLSAYVRRSEVNSSSIRLARPFFARRRSSIAIFTCCRTNAARYSALLFRPRETTRPCQPAITVELLGREMKPAERRSTWTQFGAYEVARPIRVASGTSVSRPVFTS